MSPHRTLARSVAAAASLAFLTAATAADAMTVAEFLRRAGDGEIGPADLLNPRKLPVINELKTAGKALKAADARSKVEGRGPLFCPPRTGSMRLPELIAAFRALPPADQQQQVSAALPAVMRARYPCPPR